MRSLLNVQLVIQVYVTAFLPMAASQFSMRGDRDSMRHSFELESEDWMPEVFGTADFRISLEPEDDYNIRLLQRRLSIEELPDDGDQESQVYTSTKPSETHREGRDVTYAKPREGLWKRQMLVDRSLRGMALLTTIFALTMVILCTASSAQESKSLTSSGTCTSVTISSQVRS